MAENDPCFEWKKYQEMCCEAGIKLTTSTPHYQLANGLGEGMSELSCACYTGL